VVNPTRETMALALDLRDITLAGEGKVWRLTGPDEMAYNEPGKEMKVSITEEMAPPLSKRLEVPALSVSLFRMPVQ
jgi:alpha-N-arabinofuranosidase